MYVGAFKKITCQARDLLNKVFFWKWNRIEINARTCLVIFCMNSHCCFSKYIWFVLLNVRWPTNPVEFCSKLSMQSSIHLNSTHSHFAVIHFPIAHWPSAHNKQKWCAAAAAIAATFSHLGKEMLISYAYITAARVHCEIIDCSASVWHTASHLVRVGVRKVYVSSQEQRSAVCIIFMIISAARRLLGEKIHLRFSCIVLRRRART